MRNEIAVLLAATGFLLVGTVFAETAPAAATAAYRDAAAYSRAHRGLSMVVMKDGKVVFEDYAAGYSAADAHSLYSGTKSFSCAIAVAATEDGLLSLDEPVSRTIAEWRNEAQKSAITIRQLLSLTSGIDAGENGSIPTYGASIKAPMREPPGTAFRYGPVPFQIFGEIMRRKLAAGGEDVRGYLTRRVFDPIGLKVDSWRTNADGNPRMPAGMFQTAREWAKYGQLILDGGRWGNRKVLDRELLSQCFRGTAVNPGYGLTFWLPGNGGVNSDGGSAAESTARLKAIRAPDLIIKAAGVGGQKLYVIPARRLVIVRQASRLPWWGQGFEDSEFLAPILRGDG